MALTATSKNAALTGAVTKMGWVGLFKSVVFAPTSGTVIGASLINMTGAKAKGYVNGAVVVFRELTGGVTGLVALRPYYVVGEATNGFEVALEEGGAAVKVAGHELEGASTKVALLTELSGGGYKRQKATWGAAANGEITDTASEAIKVPAGNEITDAGWWEGEATGKLAAAQKLENPESFGGEGEYKVTADKLESGTVA
jgi:hypothetical protein